MIISWTVSVPKGNVLSVIFTAVVRILASIYAILSIFVFKKVNIS